MYVEHIRRDLNPETGTRISREKIEEAVKRILFENMITSPPVNVQKLAGSLGFDILGMDFTPDSGIIGWMEDRAEENEYVKSQRFIGIEKNSDSYRKINTVAHELGHFFIDCSSQEDYANIRFRCDQNIPEELRPIADCDYCREENAEAFKNELLMPWHFMRSFLEQRANMKWGEILNAVKENFFVPRHTAKYHLERKLKLTISHEDRFEVKALG